MGLTWEETSMLRILFSHLLRSDKYPDARSQGLIEGNMDIIYFFSKSFRIDVISLKDAVFYTV